MYNLKEIHRYLNGVNPDSDFLDVLLTRMWNEAFEAGMKYVEV